MPLAPECFQVEGHVQLQMILTTFCHDRNVNRQRLDSRHGLAPGDARISRGIKCNCSLPFEADLACMTAGPDVAVGRQ